MHPKTVGLIAHTGKPGVGELIKSLTAEFARFSISVLLEKETAAVSGQRSDITIAQLGGKDFECDRRTERGEPADLWDQCRIARFSNVREFAGVSGSGRMHCQRKNDI
jgi:hypothetical protein